MDLENKNLPEWLRTVDSEKFPQGIHIDHYSKYKSLKEYLQDVHKQVVVGANLIDPKILLNDHGIEHIDTVISRASYLVDASDCTLSPYEVYIVSP